MSSSLFPDVRTRLVKSNLILTAQAFQVDLMRSLCESFVERCTVPFPNDYAQLQKLEHIPRRNHIYMWGLCYSESLSNKIIWCVRIFSTTVYKNIPVSPSMSVFVHLLHAESCKIGEWNFLTFCTLEFCWVLLSFAKMCWHVTVSLKNNGPFAWKPTAASARMVACVVRFVSGQ